MVESSLSDFSCITEDEWERGQEGKQVKESLPLLVHIFVAHTMDRDALYGGMRRSLELALLLLLLLLFMI